MSVFNSIEAPPEGRSHVPDHSTSRASRFAAFGAIAVLSAGAIAAPAQPADRPAIPESNSSFLDATGTAHVTRVVPIPTTISAEARAFLARKPPNLGAMTLAQRRRQTDFWQAARAARFEERYPVRVSERTMGGVPVRIVAPLDIPAENRGRVLINLHGGGFDSDSGSLTETVPIANLTRTKVVAVLYRLQPEHPFPAQIDDAIAVYRHLLERYQPRHICIYGTSAGAILTPQVAVRLRQLGLPLPGCLGVFSGVGDFSQRGDSQAIFGLFGLSGPLGLPRDPPRGAGAGTAKPAPVNLKDPLRSPLYADLRGFPPTLFISSERDMLLSGTTILHRAFLRAGVDARLVVFEGLPHAFWNHPGLPETNEADEIMAAFFDRHLGHRSGSPRS
ncbi:MAG: alpha/beta hydrolase fold domain-containing protein [Gammaproteobacteria bacterium]|nr:alpha/beta hydrolase fold domain-containing protein [Gammaproteobacteria bacterium]